MQETKICKQCKHWSYEQSIDVCKHELSLVTNKGVNRIDGSVQKAVYKECSFMRFYSNCGEEGILFEPKVSLLSKIISLFKKHKTQ